MHFDPVARVSDLSDGIQDTPLWRFFFSRLYLSDSIFFFKDSLDLNVAWFAEGIFSLTKIAMEIGKDIFSVMTVTIAKRENASSETWTL